MLDFTTCVKKLCAPGESYIAECITHCTYVLHFYSSYAALDQQSLGPEFSVQPNALNEQVTFVPFGHCRQQGSSLEALSLITGIPTGGFIVTWGTFLYCLLSDGDALCIMMALLAVSECYALATCSLKTL